MYSIAKIAQAAGLTIILIGFLTTFPNIMSRKLLGFGVALFAFGWIIQKFLLKQ